MKFVGIFHEGIPSFVTRGLRTLADPTDLGSVRYANEADLRDAMALTWWLHGWDVRTEVKVPNCGRIDVLATSRHNRVVIELKQRIKTAAEARNAYQQATTYTAYLGFPGEGHASHTLVTAGDFDNAAVVEAERAFYRAWGAGFGVVAALSRDRSIAGDDIDVLARVARNRRDELRLLADLASGAAAATTLRAELRVLEGGVA